MSIVRMSPEFIATIRDGAIVRVIKGGAPMGAKVRRIWLEPLGVEESPHTVCVEVDDGIDGDRAIVFEEVPRLPATLSADVPLLGEPANAYVPRYERPIG